MSDFTDRPSPDTGKDQGPVGRKDYLFSFGGHALLLVLGLVTFSSRPVTPMGGDNVVSVRMVTLSTQPAADIQESVTPQIDPEEIPEEQVEEAPEEIPEETLVQPPDEQVEEVPEEIPEETLVQPPDEQLEELPEEIPEEENPPAAEYASVSGAGSTAGSGVPGPGTYESRVFNAIRRNFRTSVEPERSYRIVYTVQPDGSVSVEVVRDSGTSAFDRAVENALSMAQIPPMPPGRSSPVVLSIEFLAPE